MALKYGNERVWHVEYYVADTGKWELLQHVKYGSKYVFSWYDYDSSNSHTINSTSSGGVFTGTVQFAKLDSSKTYSNDTVIGGIGKIRLGGRCIRVYNNTSFEREFTFARTGSYIDTYHFISSSPSFSSLISSSDSETHSGITIPAYSSRYIWLCMWSQTASVYTGQNVTYSITVTNGKTTLSAPNLTDTSSADSYAVYFQVKIRNTNGVPVKVYGKVGSNSYSEIRSNLDPSQEFTYYYGYIYGSTTFYAYFTTTSTSYTSQSTVNSVTNGGPSGGGSTGS